MTSKVSELLLLWRILLIWNRGLGLLASKVSKLLLLWRCLLRRWVSKVGKLLLLWRCLRLPKVGKIILLLSNRGLLLPLTKIGEIRILSGTKISRECVPVR